MKSKLIFLFFLFAYFLSSIAFANETNFYIKKGNYFFQEFLQTNNVDLLDDAYLNYYKASELGPSAQSFLGMGMVFLEKKMFPQAKHYLYKAYSIDENDSISNYYLAKFAFHKKDYTRAIYYFKRAYEMGLSDNYDTNYFLGVLYEKVGNLEAAKTYYQNAQKLNTSICLSENFNRLEALEKNKEKYTKN